MKEKYWKKNILYLRILLTIWFISSFGFGILFAEDLNSIFLGGFPLGFWFAQQGSIYIFVILIFIYVIINAYIIIITLQINAPYSSAATAKTKSE